MILAAIFFMPTYTRAYLKTRVNAAIKGKIGVLIDANATLNDGVRQVSADADLNSALRKTALVPNLFQEEGVYAAPVDLKGSSISTIQPQTNRSRLIYDLVPFEEFGRRKDPNTIAIDDHDLIKKICINSRQPLTNNYQSMTVAPLDTTTSGGGTWAAVENATNLRADTDNFVCENGSLRFDLDATSSVIAGIQNTALNLFDASNYFGGNSALFVYVWISSITGITNFQLKIGSSISNYYSKTITSNSDGTVFQVGWNLLRFDLTNLTTVGTPVVTAFNFISLLMGKLTTKVTETDYRFDSIVLKKGEPNNLYYYSMYPWQDVNGNYKENSTADTDYLNCNSDEFNLILLKCTEFAAAETDEEIGSVHIVRAKIIFNPRYEKYKAELLTYQKQNPSLALNMISTVADFKHT